MIRRLLIAVGGTSAVVGLTACSPADLQAWHDYWTKTSNTTTVTVSAAAGPDDGGGSWFRAIVVCDGEPFWRRGSDRQVNGNADADGRYTSKVQCFDNRKPIGISWERWR